ncbi:MAG: hypothetical protein IJY25_01665 [Bacilli bacterium]|nr:hypothetical protein [Bacilli bacterium]
MFIPVVPYTRTTVINKTIVYSDTVLNLKDLGSNIKVKSIQDVSEFELERCLKTIFESNPDVTFNTIQYSKTAKEVYFYTDKEISTKNWEYSKITVYKPLSNNKEILEEIKHILTQQKIKDNDSICIYEVSELIKRTNGSYERMKDCYSEIFEDTLYRKYGKVRVVVYNFDYYKDELTIGFNYFGKGLDYDDITFSKQNSELYLKKSETSRGMGVLVALNNDLNELYDKFMKYSGFMQQSNYKIKSVNSKFLVNISHNVVNVGTHDNFCLESYSYKNDFCYECNSSSVISELKGNEEELFKKIFVKIKDCPKWMQEQLYEIRQNQLAEEQRIEDENKYQEMKKQKRLEFRNKIFPFLKK